MPEIGVEDRLQLIKSAVLQPERTEDAEAIELSQGIEARVLHDDAFQSFLETTVQFRHVIINRCELLQLPIRIQAPAAPEKLREEVGADRSEQRFLNACEWQMRCHHGAKPVHDRTTAGDHDQSHERADPGLQVCGFGVGPGFGLYFDLHPFMGQAVLEYLNHRREVQRDWTMWLCFGLQGTVGALAMGKGSPVGCLNIDIRLHQEVGESESNPEFANLAVRPLKTVVECPDLRLGFRHHDAVRCAADPVPSRLPLPETGAATGLAVQQLGPVFRRRLAQDFFEDPIEVGQGLEPDLESDLADAEIGVQEEVLGFLDANS